jgi:hypothetical protein
MVSSVVVHNVVLVRIVRPQVVRPGNLLLGGGVVDLLAEIPVERRVMAEPRYQFAVVELALRPEVALIEQQLVFDYPTVQVCGRLGQVVVRVRICLGQGFGTRSFSFAVRFGYSFAVVSCSMRSSFMLSFGGDA